MAPSPPAQPARTRRRADDEQVQASLPSGPTGGTQQAAARSEAPDEKQLFSCKRRKRGEPARCRVPGCAVELPSQFHEKYRICPRHYTAPSVHVAGEAWRFCQQCAKFHTLAEFTDDRRSCNKSLTSHNRRRRGVPRSAPRAAGDTSSGGSGGRRTARRAARGTAQEAAPADGVDAGSSGSIRGSEGASPHATAGDGGATPPVSASAAAHEDGAEGSKSSSTPQRSGDLTSPAGSGSLGQQAPRHNSAPPAACALPPAEQPFLPTIADQGGLPWPPPTSVDRAASAPAAVPAAVLPPLPSLGLPWQGPPGAAPLQAQDEEGRNFDSVLLGLLLADSPRVANGEGRQQTAHAALLDTYGALLDQPESTVPTCQELLDIADELGIFADHLADPVLPGSNLVPEQAQQAQPTALSGGTPTSVAGTVAPHSVQPADALAGAAGGSSSTATASSSATASLMPRFPGLPGDASTAVAAALQAAQAAGMPALPLWQQAQQAARQGGKQGEDAATLAEQYTSRDKMERLSFKIFGCHPSELAPDVHTELYQMVQASMATRQPQMQGFVRSGCTFLTVDLRVERPEEDAGAGAGQAALAHGGSGGGSGGGDAGEGPSQSLQQASRKQLGGLLRDPEAGGAAGSSACQAAALLQSLTAQALQRRSMGVAASASPLLAQLNTQQLVAAAGGRMLRSMPLPAVTATPAANATPTPQLPRLTAISPACLVLPPAALSAPDPPVIVLTGHGLFAHTGRPGLVLARQHGRHLPVEVWGGSDGGTAGPGALVVSVTGLRPGMCELEVQRGSMLGSSRPLLLLPAGMEATAAELATLASSGGSGAAGGSASAGADAFLRDVGAVVAWVELRGRQAAAPAGPAAFSHSSGASLDSESGSESGSESDAEQEEQWDGVQRDAVVAEAEGRQDSTVGVLPLLPPAHVARLARHAARFALRCGWDATAVALESAAAAAAEAAEVAAAAAAAAPPAPVPAPGWVPGSAALQRDEHALDFEFWAPLWQQQLQREGQAVPAVPLTAWWQPAAGAEAQQQALPGQRYWVTEDDLKAQGAAARSGLAGWKAVAAVAVVLSTAAALSALCWG